MKKEKKETKEEKPKNEDQLLINAEGKAVEFIERSFDKEFYRIETDTCYLEQMAVSIEKKKTDVEGLFNESKNKTADMIAESYIRGATKPKKGLRKMTRKNYLQSIQRSWILFKEKIFGYNELTPEQIAEDDSEK